MFMTNAPSNLLAVRDLLLTHLGPHGLASAEVGIVGSTAHRGGYHCGRDRTVSNDYSVTESKRDSGGLTLDASALDVGEFTHGSHNLRTFSVWCVEQCEQNAPDTRDIREIIYSPDGKHVSRYDRLGIRSSGDSSHLFHTHFSLFRDSTKARRDQRPLFRRYLTTIGLIESEDTMSAADAVTGFAQALAYAADPTKAPTESLARTGRQVRDNLRAVLQPVIAAESANPAEVSAALQPIRDLVEQVRPGGITPDEFVREVARVLGGASA